MTWSTLLYSLPPALTAVFLAVLAVVPLMRGRLQPAIRIFSLLCVFGCLLNLDILVQMNASSARVALRSCRIGHLLHPFLLPLFIHFFHAYLKVGHRRWLVRSGYAYAALIAACSQSDLIIGSMRLFHFGYAGQGGRLYLLMAVGAIFATIYNLTMLCSAIAREGRSIEKNKLKYILTGFVSLGVLTSLNMLPRFGLPVYPPGNFGFIPLAIFAAGLFKHDLLDIGLLIRKGLLYSAITGLLTVFYALLVIGIQIFFKEIRLSDSLSFPVFLFGLITFVFGPLRTHVRKIIDHLFSRGRFDYQQTIKKASQTIASVLDVNAITRLLKETIVDAMHVEHCILFTNDSRNQNYRVLAAAGKKLSRNGNGGLSENDQPVKFLLQKRTPLIRRQLLGRMKMPQIRDVLLAMAQWEAELILPMLFQNRLNGFIMLGEKSSGEMYSSEDLYLLETLCLQSALAIENARAYHALNELNRSLEAKVVERTCDLRRALEEKERTQEQLIRSESLASLGQLVAGAAHELNNPLASVTSLLQSTVEDLENWEADRMPDEELLDDLYFAGKELGRAKSIVASLLGLARQTQTYEEAVDFNAVARDALRVLYGQHKHTRIRVRKVLDENIPSVPGNFANLGQVVLNIIKNAMQAVDQEEGRISLHTRLARSRSQVVFACRDNGPGIAAGIRRDVFKPFFTTKPVGQGTGLGLYICHEIIRKHGGTIDIEPVDPQGTAVTVRLPVGRRPMAVTAES